jgi:hypothetical protein
MMELRFRQNNASLSTIAALVAILELFSGALSGQSLPPSKEYIRLGSQVIAIENAAALTDTFFTGEVSLGSGWYYLQFSDGSLFGYYNFSQGSASTSSAIFYHEDLGFEYITTGSASGSVYFYDYTSGHWWYTSNTLFPYLYDFTIGAWLYYFPLPYRGEPSNPGHYTSSPRYFQNMTTNVVFTM